MKDNELLITIEILTAILQPGNHHYGVLEGPAPEAKVIDIRFDGQTLALTYDRPISQPKLTTDPCQRVFLEIANLAHLAWLDKEAIRETFQMIEQKARTRA